MPKSKNPTFERDQSERLKTYIQIKFGKLKEFHNRFANALNRRTTEQTVGSESSGKLLQRYLGGSPIPLDSMAALVSALGMSFRDFDEKIIETPGFAARAYGLTPAKYGPVAVPDTPSTGGQSNVNGSSPWVTDGGVLEKYRIKIHRYLQTLQGNKVFWIYVPTYFTMLDNGCLRGKIHIGFGDNCEYEAYGYLLGKILVIVSQGTHEGHCKEAVHLFHNFRQSISDKYGYCGVSLNGDWNGDKLGYSAVLIFSEPLPGTEGLGEQSAAVCEALDKKWKELDGECCNRLLHLFDYPPYTRPYDAAKENKKARRKERNAAS